MDIPCDTLRLNGRRFKNKKLLVQLPRRDFAGDRSEGVLHKIPDFYFEQARTDFMESSLLGPQFGYLLRATSLNTI